MMGSKKFPKL